MFSPIIMTANCWASSIRQPPLPHWNSVHCYEISRPLLDFSDDRISPVARLDKMKIWNLYTLSLKNCTSIEFCWGYEFSNSENDFWMQIPAEAEEII